MLDSLRQDVRIAARLLRKSPVFTATAALSLAVGIGANTAIFSVVNALMFKGRPGISDSGRLVDVGRTRSGRGFDTTSYPNYLDLQQRVPAFSGLAAYRVAPTAVSVRDTARDAAAPERIYVSTVSGNFFDVLGTRPAAGRLFGAAEDASARTRPTIVLSHALWERKYRRDPSVVGRSVTVNGVDVTVVGVAARGFRGTSFMAADAWVPIGTFPLFNVQRGELMLTERRMVWLVLVARLAEGSGITEAQAQLATVARQLEADHPDANKDMSWTVTASALVPAPFRGAVTAFAAVLMGIVGLVLLIACVNLAGVLLARGANRRRELAVRLAVGAGRGRLVRQLVTETVVLFGVGGAAGVLLGAWIAGLIDALTAMLPVPVALDVSLDFPVLIFASAITLVSGILAGIMPALQAARVDLVAALKADPSAGSAGPLRLRSALLVGQVALSCVLFLAAALFARSLQQAGRIDPGFDASNVDVVALDFAMGGHRGEGAVRTGEELIDRVRAVPGVTHAALTRMVPLTGGGMELGMVAPAGRDPERDRVDADWNVVTPEYFGTLRIGLLQGRGFTAADRKGAPPVAIVNETFARRAWPSSSAIGQRLVRQTPDERSELLVVGVARDGKYRTLGEAPVAYIYVPHAQQPMEDMSLLARSAGPSSAVPGIREALRQVDPNMPLITAQRFADAVALALVPQRLAATLAGALGLVGLALAAFGIYGVTAFAVAQRTREIGVRLALGAKRSEVLRLVLRQGFSLALAGVLIGMALGALASRVLSGWLYGPGASDPISFVAVAAVFLSTSAVATWLPARIAVRIEPSRALRVD